jgi:ribosomal protein L11 methyltransferase
VILSGLLPSQANGVIAAYRANGLILRKRIELEGWTSLLLGPG